MRVVAKITGLGDALAYHSDRVFAIVDDETKAGGDGLRQDLRQQTEDALGVKVANAWRGKFFANAGQLTGPAAFIWSKAPKIIDFFSASRMVTPIGEAFAVPTENVPRGPRGRRLTPIEVEARFNAELQPVRLKTGRLGLFIDVMGRRGGSKGRRAQRKMVLMFVMLRNVRSRQLVDLSAAAQRWGARIAANINKQLGN